MGGGGCSPNGRQINADSITDVVAAMSARRAMVLMFACVAPTLDVAAQMANCLTEKEPGRQRVHERGGTTSHDTANHPEWIARGGTPATPFQRRTNGSWHRSAPFVVCPRRLFTSRRPTATEIEFATGKHTAHGLTTIRSPIYERHARRVLVERRRNAWLRTDKMAHASCAPYRTT